MGTASLLTAELRDALRCPACKGPLRSDAQWLHCEAEWCRAAYPIIDNIPILINDATSLFSIDDFVRRKETTVPRPARSLVGRGRAALSRRMPTLSANVKARANYAHLAELLVECTPRPRVLVIGGGILGQGLSLLLAQPAIALVETDVSFGPRTGLICDAHDLPFAAATFDAVIAQAVLEHVVEPSRCADEIYRVLRQDGMVYAETPFMQQVHAGRYDFTRFTHLGHRRLFRRFEEIDSGAVCGPGMALAWSCQYFLLSFAGSRAMRSAVKGLTRLTLFWLPYLDRYLIEKPAALDAAAGYYFLGRKGSRVLTDRELIAAYRGAD